MTYTTGDVCLRDITQAIELIMRLREEMPQPGADALDRDSYEALCVLLRAATAIASPLVLVREST